MDRCSQSLAIRITTDNALLVKDQSVFAKLPAKSGFLGSSKSKFPKTVLRALQEDNDYFRCRPVALNQPAIATSEPTKCSILGKPIYPVFAGAFGKNDVQNVVFAGESLADRW
jgi:hypothetical protein